MRLQETAHYLRMGELLDGRAYLVHCRNAHIGVWKATERAFAIRREKFGRTYLFDEYHWDNDAFPTAKPFVQLQDEVPDADLLGFLERLEDAHPFEAALETMWAASLALASAAAPLRIAIIGAQGTGKTTLLGGLAPRLPGLAVIPEQATEIINEWGLHPRNLDVAGRVRFQEEILRRTVDRERAFRATGFIADRSVVDNVAYAQKLPNYGELLLRVVAHLADNPYTHVFFVKKAFPLVGDGIRSTDVEYQEEIERRVAGLLADLRVPHCIVRSSGRESRVDEVLSALGATSFSRAGDQPAREP